MKNLLLMLFLFTPNLNALECYIHGTNKKSTFNIQFYNSYILIDNKYKVFYQGECNGYGEPCSIYKNKAYTYEIVEVDSGDLYAIGISSIHGLKQSAQCDN